MNSHSLRIAFANYIQYENLLGEEFNVSTESKPFRIARIVEIPQRNINSKPHFSEAREYDLFRAQIEIHRCHFVVVSEEVGNNFIVAISRVNIYASGKSEAMIIGNRIELPMSIFEPDAIYITEAIKTLIEFLGKKDRESWLKRMTPAHWSEPIVYSMAYSVFK